MLIRSCCGAAIALIMLCGQVAAQQATLKPPDDIKRTPLQKQEFPGDNFVSYLLMVELAPGSKVARHTHPGIEMGYVVEGGGGTLSVDGEPVRTLNVGDSFQVPAGVPHSATNGDKPTKIISVLVLEKGKPLASPAP